MMRRKTYSRGGKFALVLVSALLAFGVHAGKGGQQSGGNSKAQSASGNQQGAKVQTQQRQRTRLHAGGASAGNSGGYGGAGQQQGSAMQTGGQGQQQGSGMQGSGQGQQQGSGKQGNGQGQSMAQGSSGGSKQGGKSGKGG